MHHLPYKAQAHPEANELDNVPSILASVRPKNIVARLASPGIFIVLHSGGRAQPSSPSNSYWPHSHSCDDEQATWSTTARRNCLLRLQLPICGGVFLSRPFLLILIMSLTATPYCLHHRLGIVQRSSRIFRLSHIHPNTSVFGYALYELTRWGKAALRTSRRSYGECILNNSIQCRSNLEL